MGQNRVKIWINILVVVIMISIILFIITKPSEPVETDEEIVKCIADKATLYVQLGCHACQTQEDLFGENYKFLNTVDCFYEVEKCAEIKVTPTWEINGELYPGVESIAKLQEMTGC